MANKNYALIDQIGSIDNGKEVYSTLFKSLKGKFDKIWTMKKVCLVYSPNCKEITDKMKYFHRYNRTPQIVYLLCDTYTSKVQFIQNIWESRDIKTEVIVLNETTIQDVNNISKYRRASIIWAEALGWSFSAPLVRSHKDISIDMYSKRHIADNEINASYGAKRTTDPEKFLESFISVAPEEECIAFFEHYKWLFQNNLLADSLEPDWTLCPNCGRPHYINATKCNWCDSEFEPIEIEPYFDDDTRHARNDLDFDNFDNWSHADAAIKAYPKRKTLIDLFDTGCKFPDIKEYYI